MDEAGAGKLIGPLVPPSVDSIDKISAGQVLLRQASQIAESLRLHRFGESFPESRVPPVFR